MINLRSLLGKVLVLAPHTDDAELGMGASVARFIQEGISVDVVSFSDGNTDGNPRSEIRSENRKSLESLGVQPASIRVLDFKTRTFSEQRQKILDSMIVLNRELTPDTVFVPAGVDLHQDHHQVSTEARRAFRSCSLMGYELPWNQIEFAPNFFVEVTEVQIKLKASALSLYRTQSSRPYFTTGFSQSLALVRGIQCGRRFAEAFLGMRVVA